MRHFKRLVTFVFIGSMLPLIATASDARLKSIQDYEKGCEKGQMQDCVSLALAYARGELGNKKIEKNPRVAKQFSDRAIETGSSACRQGNLKNCYMVGVMYFEGDLVATDYAKGIEYVRKACVGGYKEACEWLKNSGVQ